MERSTSTNNFPMWMPKLLSKVAKKSVTSSKKPVKLLCATKQVIEISSVSIDYRIQHLIYRLQKYYFRNVLKFCRGLGSQKYNFPNKLNFSKGTQVNRNAKNFKPWYPISIFPFLGLAIQTKWIIAHQCGYFQISWRNRRIIHSICSYGSATLGFKRHMEL